MPPPNEWSVEDSFWSLVLAVARNRAHPIEVQQEYADRRYRSIMDMHGLPRVRPDDSAAVDVRVMSLDTHVIPARAARDEIGRILGYVSSRPPVDTRTVVPVGVLSSDPPPVPTAAETIAVLEMVAQQQPVVPVRATLPSPIPPVRTAAVVPPPPAPEPPPESGQEDGASVRFSLLELD